MSKESPFFIPRATRSVDEILPKDSERLTWPRATFDFSEQLHITLATLAARTKVSMRTLYNEALSEYLAAYSSQPSMPDAYRPNPQDMPIRRKVTYEIEQGIKENLVKTAKTWKVPQRDILEAATTAYLETHAA